MIGELQYSNRLMMWLLTHSIREPKTHSSWNCTPCITAATQDMCWMHVSAGGNGLHGNLQIHSVI